VPLSDDARTKGVQRFASYRRNPRAFVWDIFGAELEDYQVAIMEAIAAGEDATVRAGHGVGKTTTDALIVFWYLLTHPLSKVPTTAPTFRQVKDILWSEIAKWHTRCRLRDHLDLQKTRMAVRGKYEAEWFAIGVASNKAANMEGFHAPHLLFVVDEAKGVHKPIYDAIDGALTTGGQRLYTSTPGSRTGQFYESHFGKIAKYFRRFHISGEMSRRVSTKWRDQKKEEWGIDSPIYQAKVLGEFPNEGDDILIPLDFILEAERAELEEKCSKCGKLEECGCGAPSLPAIEDGPTEVLGCDVARFGMDETAVARGNSHRVRWVRTWSKRDLVHTTNELVGEYKRGGIVSIGVDDTGLGGGVTDNLAKIHNVPNMPVIFGAKTSLDTIDRKEHFANNKAFFAWKFRQALEENVRARAAGGAGTFALPQDDKLKGQLSNLRKRHTNKGQVQIIDPDDPTVPVSELPKGVRVSPDKAHAVIIMYHAATSAAGVSGGRFSKPTPAPRMKPEARKYSSYIWGGGRRRP
jgi:phage terminase large subunit